MSTEERFEAFYTRYKGLVRRVLSTIESKGGVDQEDLVQETFLKVWRAFGKIDQVQDTTAWVKVVAKNVGRDFLRYHALHDQHNSELDEHIADFLPDFSTRAEAIYSGEAEAIEQALGCLRPFDQQIMMLLFNESLNREVAEDLGIDARAVQGHIRRARRRFQKYYQEAA